MKSRSATERSTSVSALLLVALLAANTAVPAYAQEAREFRVAAADSATAIQDFAEQSGVQILATVDTVKDKHLNAVNGHHSTDEGLRMLLAGTGLTHRYVDDRAVALVTDDTEAGRATEANQNPVKETQKPRSFWERFRLAQAAPGNAVNTGSEDASGNTLEEIVVSAQKKQERLQDVPVPVAVVSAEGLTQSNQLLIREYYMKIPGLNMTPSQQSNQTLSIRGITTGSGSPSVGVLIDDVPYGASTNLGGGRVVPDIDPGDLAQLEVLRGPQGTLYGASSMGGLLKYVTKDPSFEGVRGRVQAGLNSVKNGDGPGYNVRGAINVPLSETLAIAASGFTRLDPGYIDDPVQDRDGVNEAKVYGGRLAALWRISDAFSVKLNALQQQAKGEGTSDADPTLGDLEQSRLLGTGHYDRKSEIYSATLSAEVGSIELTSVTGYNVNSFQDANDWSFSSGAQAQAQFGVNGVSQNNDNRTTKFTQEVRLTAPLADRLDLFAGGYFSDEDSRYTQDLLAVNPTNGVSPGRYLLNAFPTTYKDYAVFADLTYRFSDRFDVQIGGRKSWIEQTLHTTQIVNANNDPSQPIVVESIASPGKADVFTYLFTPRFKLNDDVMVYGRLASGYRAGGLNVVGINAGLIPPTYDPDETRNYEIGIKSDLLDRRLTLDASVFYIDWKKIQFLVFDRTIGFAYMTNGGRAKSQGVELSLEARPTDHLTVSGWVSYNKAELTEGFPAGATVVAADGARLPNNAPWTGSLAVDQEFPLASGLEAFAGATVSYIDDRLGQFLPASLPQRQVFPSYTKVDLRAGLRSGAWTANLYAINVADKRGVLYGGLGAAPPTSFYYLQPRTIGLNLSKEF